MYCVTYSRLLNGSNFSEALWLPCHLNLFASVNFYLKNSYIQSEQYERIFVFFFCDDSETNWKMFHIPTLRII